MSRVAGVQSEMELAFAGLHQLCAPMRDRIQRLPGPQRDALGLPELVVTGLADDDARALLSSALPRPVDERITDRIVAEARGNPLALQELPRGLAPAGGAALSACGAGDGVGVATELEEITTHIAAVGSPSGGGTGRAARR